LTFRCLPTALFRDRNTAAPGVGSAARQTDAAVALDTIMAAQRPSFLAYPWSLCPTLPKEGSDAPPVPDVYPGEIDKLW
jgi:hypothetical protein